jgi:hypothetical protein
MVVITSEYKYIIYHIKPIHEDNHYNTTMVSNIQNELTPRDPRNSDGGNHRYFIGYRVNEQSVSIDMLRNI